VVGVRCRGGLRQAGWPRAMAPRAQPRGRGSACSRRSARRATLLALAWPFSPATAKLTENMQGEKMPVWPRVRSVNRPRPYSDSDAHADGTVPFLKLAQTFEVVRSCGSSPALEAALLRHRRQLFPRRISARPKAKAAGSWLWHSAPPPVQEGSNSSALPSVCCLAQLAVCVKDPKVKLEHGADEAYRLHIDMDDSAEGGWTAELQAATQIGAYRGLETFSQLVSFDSKRRAYGLARVAPLEAQDAPYFAHRGLLLDTARHFLPLPVIYRALDGMAFAKMNVLHWHLTDAESLPAESTARPEFWGAAWSSEEVYTAEDTEDVISYAAERGIRVVPEVDVPGHSKAWSDVFPGLFPKDGCPSKWWAMDPSSNETFVVLKDVLKEFAQRFPERMFHLGGDEVGTSIWGDIRFDCWKSVLTESWLKEHKLFESLPEQLWYHAHTAHGAQIQELMSMQRVFGYFMKEVIRIVAAEGKRPIVWDETWRNVRPKLDQMSKNAIVQIWEDPSLTLQAAKEGYDVIYSPTGAWYLDDVNTTWEKMYVMDPAGDVSKPYMKKILGGEACLWTEMVDPATVDSMIWPRTAAIAERLWVGPPGSLRDKEDKIPESTRSRLARFRCRLLDRGIGASPLEGVGREGLKGPSSCMGSYRAPGVPKPKPKEKVKAPKRKKVKFRDGEL